MYSLQELHVASQLFKNRRFNATRIFSERASKMVFSDYCKRRILFHANRGLHPPTIATLLRKEGLVVSRQGVGGFLARVKEVGLGRKAGSGRRRKRSAAVEAIIESSMRSADETTAEELRQKLSGAGHQLSTTTSWRCRKELGWTTRCTAYCA